MALTVPTYCSPCGAAFIAQKSCAALRCAALCNRETVYEQRRLCRSVTHRSVPQRARRVAGGVSKDLDLQAIAAIDRFRFITFMKNGINENEPGWVPGNTAPHTSSAAHATGVNTRTHIVSGGRDRLFCALAFGGLRCGAYGSSCACGWLQIPSGHAAAVE